MPVPISDTKILSPVVSTSIGEPTQLPAVGPHWKTSAEAVVRSAEKRVAIAAATPRPLAFAVNSEGPTELILTVQVANVAPPRSVTVTKPSPLAESAGTRKLICVDAAAYSAAVR